ncbi:MAG TPA: 30S ribosomal protein S6 [Patescibacteria group bacterium]|nr:30S ribosomal protein S6 [Patescibacteria group bacterium]
MPLYETVFIARQDISAKAAEDLAKNFAKIVTDNGAEVKRTESWGLRNLAYKIKKNRKGHYTLLHIEGPASAIVEMERNIGLNEDVLRHMTVRIEKLPEGPSAVLKHSDDDRDGEGGGFRGGDREGREGGGFRGGDRGGYRGDKGGFGGDKGYRRDNRDAAPAADTPKDGE